MKLGGWITDSQYFILLRLCPSGLIKEAGGFMKLYILSFVMICFSAAAFFSCGNKPDGTVAQGELVFHTLKQVHSPSRVYPPSEAVLGVTLGFYETAALRKEILEKDADICTVVSDFGAGILKEDLTDVQRYEKMRESLRLKINAKLIRGSISRVLFRTIEIR
jgi:hypothetical protein